MTLFHEQEGGKTQAAGCGETGIFRGTLAKVEQAGAIVVRGHAQVAAVAQVGSDLDNTGSNPVEDANRINSLRFSPRILQVRYVSGSAPAGLRFAQTVVVKHHRHNATLCTRLFCVMACA